MTRDSFVEHFGEEEAQNVEAAALLHEDTLFDERGSDPFRWAICICIGFQCMELDKYRSHHGITTPWKTLKQWIKEHGDLQNHDGDVDTLAHGAGMYEEYGFIRDISTEDIDNAYTKTVLDIQLGAIGPSSKNRWN